MSIVSEITRLRNAKTALKESIEAKGVTVEDSAKLDEYPALVDSISQGGGNEYTENEYLTFTAEENNSMIGLNNIGGNAPIIYYKKNNGDYILWDYSNISMNKGDVVKMYGENNFKFSISTSKYSKFVMQGEIAASGIVHSILNKSKTPVLTPYCYYNMFNGCTSLTTAPELPSAILASNCCQSMFSGCSSLTTTPALPATVLANNCYQSMFNRCSALITASTLPATILADNCYQGMFAYCTSLAVAPSLPATVLADNCYYQMFNNCAALTTAPELPATTLSIYCYNSMFQGCTKLNYVKAMFTITPSSTYTNNWLSGVAAIGTFVKNSQATWDVSGPNGIPTGWTVETAEN